MELERLVRFIGPELSDEDWLARVSRIPRRPSSTWRRLPPDQQGQLAAACRPGLRLLGYA
jgi:hypothetical protein